MVQRNMEFRERYGPWAMVAGASVGLGAEFARQLAAQGLDLVLVARRPGPLATLAAELAKDHGVRVRSVAADLGAPDVLDVLRPATADIEVGFVVYNAAVSHIGPFLDTPLEAHLATIATNCRAPLALAHTYGAAMAARGRGGLLLMSSLAGLQGTPLVASYAATKAFDLVLGEALWAELRTRGVDVLAFCAGATLTPNFEATNPASSGRFAPRPMPVAPVVEEALAALGTRPSAIAGRGNRLAAFFMTRVLPRRRAVETMAKAMAKTYGQG